MKKRLLFLAHISGLFFMMAGLSAAMENAGTISSCMRQMITKANRPPQFSFERWVQVTGSSLTVAQQPMDALSFKPTGPFFLNTNIYERTKQRMMDHWKMNDAVQKRLDLKTKEIEKKYGEMVASMTQDQLVFRHQVCRSCNLFDRYYGLPVDSVHPCMLSLFNFLYDFAEQHREKYTWIQPLLDVCHALLQNILYDLADVLICPVPALAKRPPSLIKTPAYDNFFEKRLFVLIDQELFLYSDIMAFLNNAWFQILDLQDSQGPVGFVKSDIWRVHRKGALAYAQQVQELFETPLAHAMFGQCAEQSEFLMMPLLNHWPTFHPVPTKDIFHEHQIDFVRFICDMRHKLMTNSWNQLARVVFVDYPKSQKKYEEYFEKIFQLCSDVLIKKNLNAKYFQDFACNIDECIRVLNPYVPIVLAQVFNVQWYHPLKVRGSSDKMALVYDFFLWLENMRTAADNFSRYAVSHPQACLMPSHAAIKIHDQEAKANGQSLELTRSKRAASPHAKKSFGDQDVLTDNEKATAEHKNHITDVVMVEKKCLQDHLKSHKLALQQKFFGDGSRFASSQHRLNDGFIQNNTPKNMATISDVYLPEAQIFPAQKNRPLSSSSSIPTIISWGPKSSARTGNVHEGRADQQHPSPDIPSVLFQETCYGDCGQPSVPPRLADISDRHAPDQHLAEKHQDIQKENRSDVENDIKTEAVGTSATAMPDAHSMQSFLSDNKFDGNSGEKLCSSRKLTQDTMTISPPQPYAIMHVHDKAALSITPEKKEIRIGNHARSIQAHTPYEAIPCVRKKHPIALSSKSSTQRSCVSFRSVLPDVRRRPLPSQQLPAKYGANDMQQAPQCGPYGVSMGQKHVASVVPLTSALKTQQVVQKRPALSVDERIAHTSRIDSCLAVGQSNITATQVCVYAQAPKAAKQITTMSKTATRSNLRSCGVGRQKSDGNQLSERTRPEVISVHMIPPKPCPIGVSTRVQSPDARSKIGPKNPVLVLSRTPYEALTVGQALLPQSNVQPRRGILKNTTSKNDTKNTLRKTYSQGSLQALTPQTHAPRNGLQTLGENAAYVQSYYYGTPMPDADIKSMPVRIAPSSMKVLRKPKGGAVYEGPKKFVLSLCGSKAKIHITEGS